MSSQLTREVQQVVSGGSPMSYTKVQQSARSEIEFSHEDLEKIERFRKLVRTRHRLILSLIPCLALAGIPASPLIVKNAATGDQSVACGVFAIQGAPFTNSPALDLPYVAGLSARFAWKDLEPRQGEYDWQLLENAHKLALARKKPMIVRVVSGMHAPEWVYKLDGVRSVTFGPAEVSWLKFETRMPVPWDEPHLAAWEKMVQALGKKIDGWSDVPCVQMAGGGFIDEMHLAKRTKNALAQWKAVEVSEEKVEALWKRIISMYDKYVPKRMGIGINLAPPLDGYKTAEAIHKWALQEYPGRVWFQQNGLTARWNGDSIWSKMILEGSKTTTVGYQLGGAGERIGDRTKTYARAVEDGCSYVEIFHYDLRGGKWETETQVLAKGLEENHRKLK